MARHGGPMNVSEKSRDFKGSITRLFNNLSTWKYFLIISLVLAMVSAIISLVAPNKLSELTDTIASGISPNISEEIEKDIMYDKNISNEDKKEFQELIDYAKEDDVDLNKISGNFDKLPKSIYNIVKPKIDMSKVKSIAIFIGILYLISAIFNYVQALLMTIASNKFAKKLRSNISKKINKLPLKYFDTHETGDVLSRVTNDVDMIAHNLNNSLSSLVTGLTFLLGSLLMMFITNWIMAITAILSSLIGFALMGLILGKSQKYFTERQEQLGDLNGYIEEIYSGHNVVKAYNGVYGANKEFDNLNNKLYESNWKSQFLSGIMQPLMMFIGNFGYVAVCVVGALLVMNNIITFGVIVAFIIYVRMFSNPLSQIAQAMTSLQSVAAASERVFDFLDEKEMTNESKIKGKLNKKSVKGQIEFKNVKFGYDEKRTIINDFSAKVKPGQKIAIVGPTGAGKTTMVNLLMKFYEINSGDILIDGVSIKDLTRENIHDLFVMVLQDTWVFEGTIRDNLKFNKKNVSDKEIMKVCEVVGVDHFIKTLPGGLDAKIGDNDAISQGQKQLLTIARGMIENAPFLILDEATSNVDTRTEELVQKAMDKLTKGKTSFIIAHRLSTIKNADLILVMKDGNIIEQGTHSKLLKKNGFYAELYNSQFETIVE
ncbi:MAG: ABC transporter ATP-binding protein [Bacilli bacterium]|nr:ABC transporter ATP-binding protein [Bacilli bacterium]